MLYSKETDEEDRLSRLYCFKQGSFDTIYQFGYNSATKAYEYGYDSKDVNIVDKPDTANTGVFAMLQDGEDYRMYFLDVNNYNLLHQMVYNGDDYVIEDHKATIQISGLPENIDARSIGMLASSNDSSAVYRFYIFAQDDYQTLIQAKYNNNTGQYERSSDVPVKTSGINVDASSFSMLYDSENYWCYFLSDDTVS